MGPQELLLAAVKRRKFEWFRHVTRHGSLSKTLLQGTLEGERRRGRQRKCWMDNIKEWTYLPMPELLTKASCRKKTGRESLLNRPSYPPDDPIGQGTELMLKTFCFVIVPKWAVLHQPNPRTLNSLVLHQPNSQSTYEPCVTPTKLQEHVTALCYTNQTPRTLNSLVLHQPNSQEYITPLCYTNQIPEHLTAMCYTHKTVPVYLKALRYTDQTPRTLTSQPCVTPTKLPIHLPARLVLHQPNSQNTY